MEKYKRVCARVDLNALRFNMDSIKKNIKDGTSIMAVIKADGYGHGAIAIAKEMEKDSRIWGYAVATAEEADILKQAGMKKPILVLGAVFPYAYPMMLNENIRMTVFSYEMAKDISYEALKMQKEALIHIKLDTGMGRIGFPDTNESFREIQKIAALPNIKIEGIYTHFAKADFKDKTSATSQLMKYKEFVRTIERAGIELTVRHCSNSAAIMDMPEANMDMVRAGIILYGLMPSDEVMKERVPLKPVLTLRSHVVHVKKVAPMTGISYGHTYVTQEEKVIATVPIGYGDGYPRTLSNKGEVLINGKRAKICGRVCMDQMMIDVTDIPDVNVGDLVTLIGTDGNETITAEELGELSGRFNYELVCDIGKRVPRLYMENGKEVACKDYYMDTEINWLK
ncbi:MAG: alanine racemase [Lachnospiraceae bacterium]|nr:alanine racemase [Lachnospiraceae bacterium]